MRNGILVLGSLVFLAVGSRGNLWWLGLLLGLTVATFLAGRALAEGKRRWLMVACLVLMAALLVLFKGYQGGAMLPPGMSFYMFQMAAYLFDIHRGSLVVERSMARYSVQLMMFPKLLSGPLMRPAELQRQSWGRGYLLRDFHRGLQELILGLGLKVLLADRLGGIWNHAGVVGYESISVPFAWMALIAYALQLYFDFFGYSLMAMGLGRMLGFELPRNFDHPYASKSVSEFYRRWHMTLGEWFRHYLYFPLGGSRKGTVRTVLNLSVVWLFTGLWHGVGWNYLIWAGFLLFMIINEKLWLGKWLNRSRVLSRVYLVGAILLSWIPFAVGDLNQMFAFLGRLFGACGSAINPADYLAWGERYALILAAGAVLATPLGSKLWRRIKDHPLADAGLFVLFWIVVYFLATSSQDPFVYFRY